MIREAGIRGPHCGRFLVPHLRGGVTVDTPAPSGWNARLPCCHSGGGGLGFRRPASLAAGERVLRGDGTALFYGSFSLRLLTEDLFLFTAR